LTLQALTQPVSVPFSHVGVYAGTAANPRPIVQVEIASISPAGQLLGKPLTTSVLVDSGADVTMLDGGLATALGVNLAACPQGSIGGVGSGGVPVAATTIKMQLCGTWLDIPVNFTLQPITHPQLLGRSGAFERVFWGFMHDRAAVLAIAAPPPLTSTVPGQTANP
jgi:hypothetical protein